jgi:hypothetical protein
VTLRRHLGWPQAGGGGRHYGSTYALAVGLFDAERTRLDELTLMAIETRAEADLGLGRHGERAGTQRSSSSKVEARSTSSLAGRHSTRRRPT